MFMRIDMAMDQETKVVQTELSAREYDQLRRVAEQEDIPLKEALRRAATEYADREGLHDPDDPFFSGEDPPVEDGENLTARQTDRYLYE